MACDGLANNGWCLSQGEFVSPCRHCFRCSACFKQLPQMINCIRCARTITIDEWKQTSALAVATECVSNTLNSLLELPGAVYVNAMDSLTLLSALPVVTMATEVSLKCLATLMPTNFVQPSNEEPWEELHAQPEQQERLNDSSSSGYASLSCSFEDDFEIEDSPKGQKEPEDLNDSGLWEKLDYLPSEEDDSDD